MSELGIKSELSWRLDANEWNGRPDVKAFLLSNLQSQKFGEFTNIKEARTFNLPPKFNVVCSSGGTGRNAFVTITKQQVIQNEALNEMKELSQKKLELIGEENVEVNKKRSLHISDKSSDPEFMMKKKLKKDDTDFE